MFAQLNWFINPVLSVLSIVVGVTAIPAFAVMVSRKRVTLPWGILLLSVAPAVAVGLAVRDPWFSVPRLWDNLRLLALVSWLPALLLLEKKFTYQTSAAKWLTRYALYAVFILFTAWAWARVGSGVLIQAAAGGNGANYWLVGTDDGEDLYLFTRTTKCGPLDSKKVADSVGAGGMFKYHLHVSEDSPKLEKTVDATK
ncbi:MAG: hypothetical protein HY952_06025 [Elusimicrobia bacterium]|nr:hypothetical protein [Elusimicrobiota bacterium]